jgi:hypothetical protein
MNANTPPPQLTVRISWLGIVNYLGALLTTGWMLYLVYAGAGAVYAVLGLLLSGLALRFGASPLFAIAASVLYFHFGAGGLWLPLLSYVASGLAFHNDLQAYRARQAANQQP